MKKTIIVSLVVLAIAAIVFWAVNLQQKRQGVAVTFLPENVLCYYQQKNLGQTLSNLMESPLGKKLKTIDSIKTARQLNLPENDIAVMEKIKGETITFVNSPIFKEIFSNEYTVALLPFEVSNIEDLGESVLNHMIILTKPKHGAGLLDLISSQLGPLGDQKTQAYGDYTIRQFHFEQKRSLYAVVVDDLLIMALDPKLIKDSIDRHVKKGRSLLENEVFTKISAKFNEPETYGYVSLSLLKKQLESLPIANGIKKKKNSKMDLKGLDGMQAMGYGIWQENDRIRDKGIAVIDIQKIDPGLQALYQISPEKNRSLTFVPENILGYYWTNRLDFPTYWKMFQTDTADEKMLRKKIMEGARKQFGMDIEDVLNVFSKQGGLIAQSADAKTFLPLPNLCVFIRINDQKRFTEIAEKIIADSALQSKKQQYKGVEITSFSSPSKGGLLQLYTLQNDYFVISTNLKTLEGIIDAGQGGSSLKDNPGFKNMGAGLLDKNNAVGYIRIGEFTKTVSELLNWGRALLSVQNPEGSRKLGIVQDNVLDPLFNGLAAMYSDYAMHSRIGSDMISFESTIIKKK